MDEPSQVRRAAREAVGETTPDRLRTHLAETLDTGSMAPGTLVLLSAQAAGGGGETDDALARRAAGVQLIYDGLRVTRTLAGEEPWTDASRDRTDADLAVLAADVLVARGFYLLARTEVAETAVETVRRFGRDQTRRRGSDTDEAERTTIDRNLEADALDLAVRCGVTAVGRDVPTGLPAFVDDLAASVNGAGFPLVEDVFPPSVVDDLTTLVDGRERTGVSEGVSPTTDG